MPGEDDFARARQAHLEEARRALQRHRGKVVLSHETAAIALSLPTYRIPAKVHLTRSDGSRRTQGRTDVSVAELLPGDVWLRDGLPVTSMSRTVIDVARTRPFLEALVTADAAMRRGLRSNNLSEYVVRIWNWPGRKPAAEVARWGRRSRRVAV